MAAPGPSVPEPFAAEETASPVAVPEASVPEPFAAEEVAPPEALGAVLPSAVDTPPVPSAVEAPPVQQLGNSVLVVDLRLLFNVYGLWFMV